MKEIISKLSIPILAFAFVLINTDLVKKMDIDDFNLESFRLIATADAESTSELSWFCISVDWTEPGDMCTENLSDFFFIDQSECHITSIECEPVSENGGNSSADNSCFSRVCYDCHTQMADVVSNDC